MLNDLFIAACPIWILIWIVAISTDILFRQCVEPQIELHKERALHRREYELFKAGVKSGLYVDEQVEDENRRIVK